MHIPIVNKMCCTFCQLLVTFDVLVLIISTLLSGYRAEHKCYRNRPLAYPICLSVCLSVCVCVHLSVGWPVRKVCCGKTADWIRMPFWMVSGVSRLMGELDGGGDRRREKGSFGGKYGVSR